MFFDEKFRAPSSTKNPIYMNSQNMQCHRNSFVVSGNNNLIYRYSAQIYVAHTANFFKNSNRFYHLIGC